MQKVYKIKIKTNLFEIICDIHHWLISVIWQSLFINRSTLLIRWMSQGAVSQSARVWSSSAWRLIVPWVSTSTSQALYAHVTSICLVYGTSSHLSQMRSHTRSPAASWGPDLTTVTRCYSSVPTETLTSCSACRIIWPVSFATLVA